MLWIVVVIIIIKMPRL